jgi:ribonucleotide reductase alpha subunit
MAAAYQRPRQVNIRHRNQWDILKVQRMKDQIVNYQHQLTLVKLVTLTHHTSQLISTIIGKIEERQRCLQLHPSRYYRPGP